MLMHSLSVQESSWQRYFIPPFKINFVNKGTPADPMSGDHTISLIEKTKEYILILLQMTAIFSHEYCDYIYF